MELNTNNNKLFGVHEGVYYGQNERVDELNSRMSNRHFPDSALQPNFDPRPVPTKYALFPLINRRTPLKEPVVPYLDYDQTANFNPGSSRAPPTTFLNNIDIETTLRNQRVALQRGADQGLYIPASDSDLYRTTVPVSTNNVPQPHPDLFTRQQFETYVHPNVAGAPIGNDQFFNHTRTQLRNTAGN